MKKTIRRIRFSFLPSLSRGRLFTEGFRPSAFHSSKGNGRQFCERSGKSVFNQGEHRVGRGPSGSPRGRSGLPARGALWGLGPGEGGGMAGGRQSPAVSRGRPSVLGPGHRGPRRRPLDAAWRTWLLSVLTSRWGQKSDGSSAGTLTQASRPRPLGSRSAEVWQVWVPRCASLSGGPTSHRGGTRFGVFRCTIHSEGQCPRKSALPESGCLWCLLSCPSVVGVTSCLCPVCGRS